MLRKFYWGFERSRRDAKITLLPVTTSMFGYKHQKHHGKVFIARCVRSPFVQVLGFGV